MCCTGKVKREGIRIEESVICDGVFEGSEIVHLVSVNIVADSGIRDEFLNYRNLLCIFIRVRVKFVCRVC